MNILRLAFLFITVAAAAQADTVVTKDGALLTGTITLIDKGVIHLDTSYAGSIQINQEEVASFETDEPVVVRLHSGTVMEGPVRSSSDGSLKIASADGALETSSAKVAASWAPGSEDPEVARNRRQWSYDAGLDVAGKTGNTEKFRVGADLHAELKGPNDSLALFFEYEQAEEEGNQTDDSIAGGASYERFFSKVLGWYVRTELEQDRIDEIDLRSTSGAGLSYRLIDTPDQSLILRSGAGYKHTSFTDGSENESSATVDVGIAHEYAYKGWFSIDTDITYVPQTDDFSNYRIVHDTGIIIPIGSGNNWKLRMGVENEYESQPANAQKLDTSYYTRMVYSWR